MWSSDQGQLLATLRGHAAEVTDMSLSPDNSMIASGSLDKTVSSSLSPSPSQQSTISLLLQVRVWCAQSSATTAVLTGHTGHITSVQFSPCLHDDQRWVKHLQNLSFRETLSPLVSLCRVPYRLLASTTKDGFVYFWLWNSEASTF